MDAMPPTKSPGGGALQRLDAMLVPRLQRGLLAIGRALGWPARALAWVDRRVAGGRLARAVVDRRALVAFLVVAMAFVGAATNFQRYPELRSREAQRPDGGAPGAAATGGDEAPGSVAIGPRLDARVGDYARQRREALDEAPTGEPRVAVVSFDAFVTGAEADEALGGLEAHRLQYQLPERDPQPTTVDVEGSVDATVSALVDELVEELRTEEEDVRSTLETVDDDEFRADYEVRLEELVALRNILQQRPAIVFAVVVEAPTEDLQGVADHSGVRLVDLGPREADPATTPVFGLLPSDRERASFGRVR